MVGDSPRSGKRKVAAEKSMGLPSKKGKTGADTKQRTISSFFAPKAVAVATSSSTATLGPASIRSFASGSKRTTVHNGNNDKGHSEVREASERSTPNVEEDVDMEETEGVTMNEPVLEDTPMAIAHSDSEQEMSPFRRPSSSRRRVILSPVSGESDNEGAHAESGDETPPVRKPRKPSSKIARTERFKFRSGGTQDGSAAVLDTSHSEERNQLRQRFLAKFSVSEAKTTGTSLGTKRPSSDDENDEASASKKQRGPSPATPIKRGAAGKKKSPYTPLEQQFLEIKAQHQDCLLVVEVGYKFRFFGEDAKIAAKELNIVAYMDHSMYTAGIPTHRLHVHVKKLVQLGYKVGIVRQMETAALKGVIYKYYPNDGAQQPLTPSHILPAAGDNKGGPFVRKLTQIFTKGTFVDDMVGEDDAFEVRSSYLMCINEQPSKTTAEKTDISIVAVQLSTGDVVFDAFEDGFMRNELETRLLHIQPTELILPHEQMSEPTEKMIRYLTQSAGASGDKIRVERLKHAFLEHSAARAILSEFYSKESEDGEPADEAATAERYSQALSLPRQIIVCLAALLSYLKEFGLEHVLRLTKFFSPFAAVGHMVLNANTLNSLEIFRNETDYEERGSLLWVLDHTKTKFGQRTLRKWVGRPLVQISELEKRIAAVQELIEADAQGNVLVQRMKGLLCQLPEVYNTLYALEKLAMSFSPDAGDTFTSPVLRDIYNALPPLRNEIMYFQGLINPEAAKANDKINLFTDFGKWPEIREYKMNIETVEEEFEDHLQEIKKLIQKPSLAYATVAGIENKSRGTVPYAVHHRWAMILTMGKQHREANWCPKDKIKERDRYREQLAAACDAAFSDFVAEIGAKYELFRNAIQAVATADCLLSLMVVAGQPGYCKPDFVNESIIEVKEGRHPMVEQFLSSYVPNSIEIDEHQRCLLITGPNMGGKSSYIRQVALIVIMAQIGSYVPAESARLGIFDAVYTRMGASDDISRQQSTFMKELQETSDLIRLCTPRSLVILDELGRGTSTHDGTAIAFATLKHLVDNVKSVSLFVTHYPVLGALERESGRRVRNMHMGFIEEGEEDDKTVVFLYKLTPGLAHRSYGLNVARLANLPGTLLETARLKSAEMEEKTESRKLAARNARAYNLIRKCWDEALDTQVLADVRMWVAEKDAA
ncbi:Mismatch repair protein msh3 [Borealophlyctis nickersoniae]|nr:Mismatch repair protein msh3 [Borealophlyctis nickersoniae]